MILKQPPENVTLLFFDMIYLALKGFLLDLEDKVISDHQNLSQTELWLGLWAGSGRQHCPSCIQVMFGSLALGQRCFCHGFED